MNQHYTRLTQSISKWCRHCKANTQHRVDSHVVTRVCIPCQEKDEAERKARLANPAPAAAKQEELFA